MRFDDLSFEKEEDINIIQKNLLLISKSKEEINNIIKISEGIINSLKFINNNCEKICGILEKNAKLFSFKETNFLLSLLNLRIDNNIDVNIEEINKLLTSIFEFTKNKNYNIINLEEIFDILVNFYINKPLDEFCKLEKIIVLLKSQKINEKIIENFYNKFHNRGLNLIKNNKLKIEEIINFLTEQDIYYKNPIYKNNENRDPIIFKYIPITDVNKDYLLNIELIKKYKLYELFSESNDNLKTKFYKEVIDQIKKIKDFKSIFEIFPIKSINKDFNFLLNGKFRDIIYTILDEKEENYNIIYEVIDNFFKCNNYNDLDLKYIFDLIQINYNFPSKYYFYLLKNKNLEDIISKIKSLIINFFLQQNMQQIMNAETLISLLLLSPNNNFSLSLLNKMDNMIIKENDIYQKEDTVNFLLFKLFFQKCGELLKNEDISQGKYLYESIILKTKISNDLTNFKIKYDLAFNLIDENDSFYQKILVISDQNENQSKNIYNKMKENLNFCKQKFDKFELIEDFYTTFYNGSKSNIIKLIKEKLNELKQKNIEELIKLEEHDFIINNEFNYEEAFEEAKNIKYKNSCFFMSIYRKKYDNENIERSEDEIFKNSIENYIDTIKRIIEQKDTKEPFFGINNVNEIMSSIQNNNNNLEDEIKFIEIEFAHLGKEDYIKNDLLNDLINFSIKDKTIKLLKGIIYFIESYNQINEIQITEFMNNLKTTFDSVNSNEVSGEEIKKAIDLLKKYDYDIKKETSIIKFFELLLGKQEAILFIKKIKDSNLEIRNLNEFIDESDNSQLQTTDIDNLIDVYTFFKKLMNNKEIKTDEEFLQNFRKEFDNDKEIVIKLQGYLNTYGEIIQLYQSYDENPEMTSQKIENLLKDSEVKIYKDKKTDIFIYNIRYKNQTGQLVEATLNELEELRNKILMSSTNTNIIKNEENVQNEKKTKKI